MRQNVCELKLSVLSGICRMIGRALYLEHAIEDVIAILSDITEVNVAAVLLRNKGKNYFAVPAKSKTDHGLDIRKMYKNELDLVYRVAQPFALLNDSTIPLFLDRKKLLAIRKEQIRLFGAPIVVGESVAGIILVDRIFDDETNFAEDVRFLSVIADVIAQLVSIDHHAGRREELLMKENMALRTRMSEAHLNFACLGKSAQVKKLEQMIKRVAPGETSVFLTGETGTEKKSLARLIHELSPMAAHPFVVVHCSLPEDLLEEELFANAENGLSGAAAAKTSRFEEANGGTLFLDEVGDLSTAHQIKILEFLEQAESKKFGIARSKELDVRLISASSTDLSDAIARGLFIKGLFHKLSTFHIRVPSLKERREDIPCLIDYFIAKACEEYGRNLHIGPRALIRLCEYDWPGNLHEMRNSIIRLLIMAAGDEIKSDDLSAILDPAFSSQIDIDGHNALSRLDEMERKEVSAALERNRWIQRKAATELGLTFRQLNYRVKKFGLERLIHEKRTRIRGRS